jgi:hypothetical protein
VSALRIAAAAEAVTLVVLLTNLATTHADAISSLFGPLHGTAYLVAIALTWRTSARWFAVIPGIGGLLALRRLTVGVPGRD